MSDPLFPCSASGFVPSWCVRIDGGELKGGRTVYVDTFHMDKDPIGYKAENHPWHNRRDGTREEQIERGISRAHEALARMWGQGRPVYVVPPDFSTSDLAPGSWISPRHRCMAWLTSKEMDPEYHGSHLMLIWWQEGGDAQEAEMWEADCPTMIEAVERILQTIKWEDHARDFHI